MRKVLLILLGLVAMRSYAAPSPVDVYFFDGYDQNGSKVIGLGSEVGMLMPQPEFDAYILNKENHYTYAGGIKSGNEAFVQNDGASYVLTLHPWMITQQEACISFKMITMPPNKPDPTNKAQYRMLFLYISALKELINPETTDFQLQQIYGNEQDRDATVAALLNMYCK